MDSNSDINLVFEKIRDYFSDKDEKSHLVFHMLVDVALKFRDELINQGQQSLTVDETKQALESFMNILKTREFPKNLEGRKKDLVIRWLEELKKLKPN